MSATEEFVAQCSVAVVADQPLSAAEEVVAQAARDRRLTEELLLEPGVGLLHHGEDLTILQVMMAEGPAGAGSPITII